MEISVCIDGEVYLPMSTSARKWDGSGCLAAILNSSQQQQPVQNAAIVLRKNIRLDEKINKSRSLDQMHGRVFASIAETNSQQNSHHPPNAARSSDMRGLPISCHWSVIVR